MKIIVVLSAIVVTVIANAQSLETPVINKVILTQKNIALATDSIFDKLVTLRRTFHANPELAGNEKQTQQAIKLYLQNLGLEVKTSIYGYGIVGILKGAKKGKAIAWRADMDALPNNFADNVPFKSTNKGVQHGCGHDVHITIALGIAEVLSKHKKDLHGTVYFVFQPEEETFKGAKGMVQNNLFKVVKASEMYGLHVTPFSVGEIMVKANEMYAYQQGISIQFTQNISTDSLVKLHAKIRKALTRTINNSKPWELQHALDPKDGLANPNTIYKDYFVMDDNVVSYAKNKHHYLQFDCYETNKSKLKDIVPAIKNLLIKEGLSAEIIGLQVVKENPTINNNPHLTNSAIKTLQAIYGNRAVTIDYGQIPFSNDDFSYFQQKVPGVYFYLGGSNFQKGMVAMIHAPNFMVDEECIRVGVQKFSTLIFSRGFIEK